MNEPLQKNRWDVFIVVLVGLALLAAAPGPALAREDILIVKNGYNIS